MRSPRWIINRLRCMERHEIAHRVRVRLETLLERNRLAHGWLPPFRGSAQARATLFPVEEMNATGWREGWARHGALEQDALQALFQGRIDWFGHKDLPIGTPIQWHLDPLTGRKAPLTHGKGIDYRDDRLVGNIKVLWELGRHQFLVPLAVAHAVTGAPAYRERIGATVGEWLDANPFGMGIHWCSSLEVALRVIAWAVTHSLLVLGGDPRGLFGAVPDPDALARSIHQHGWFIRHFLSLHSSANNHLVGELTGLWTATQLFDLGEDGATWGELARDMLQKEAKLQVFPDGVNREQAFYYHMWVLEYLLFAHLVAVRSARPFDDDFRKTIRKMAAFLRAASAPGGDPPQVGDADDGMVNRFSLGMEVSPYKEVLSAERAVFEGVTARGAGSKPFWYAWMGGAGADNLATREEVAIPYPCVFPEGGYAIMNQKGRHLLFDAGSLGYRAIAAHGHADGLAVCLAIDGLWWLVDPGTYAYHSSLEWRDYFRSTAAHNTITVENASQSEMGGPFMWLRHAHAFLTGSGRLEDGTQWAQGHHDGYRDEFGVIHHRRVTLDLSGSVTVTDSLEGREMPVVLHWHLHPGITARRVSGDVWRLSRPDSDQQDMVLELRGAEESSLVQGRESPPLGWYSQAMGSKCPCGVIRCTARLGGDNRSLSTLIDMLDKT